MQKLLIALLAAVIVIALEAGFLFVPASNEVKYFKTTGDAIANAAANANANLPAPVSKGSFAIEYDQPQNNSFEDVYQMIKQSGIFDGMVQQLNHNIMIPANIVVVFSQCGSANSYYDPQQKEVHICYELVSAMKNLYSVTNTTESSSAAALDNTEFILYHEIGHSLIDNLNLPVTGKEEDAADQFATLMVMHNGQNNDNPLMVTAYALGILGNSETVGKAQLADEHPTDSQRFFNLLCWIYGDNPSKYQAFVSQFLPSEREQRCSSEYAKMASSWQSLLQSYLKTS